MKEPPVDRSASLMGEMANSLPLIPITASAVASTDALAIGWNGECEVKLTFLGLRILSAV